MTLPLEPWHWWTAGVLLAILEIVLPGTFILWLGLAAVAVGILLKLFPGMGWEVQLVLFALFSVGSVALGKRLVQRYAMEAGDNLLNRRGAEMVGRTVPLATAITGGSGRITVDDGGWVVVGADAPKGAMVRIVALEGSAFRVLPAEVVEKPTPFAPPPQAEE